MPRADGGSGAHDARPAAEDGTAEASSGKDASVPPADDGGSESDARPDAEDGGAEAAPGRDASDASSPDADAAVSYDAAIGCGTLVGVDPASPWPAAQRCPSRTSSTPREWTTAAHATWGVGLASIPGIYTMVLGADGTIYCGTQAFTAAGAPRWTYAPPGLGDGSFQLIRSDGTLMLLADNGTIHAVSPDGLTRWATTVDGGAPFGSFVVASDGSLRAFSGTVLYSVDTNGGVTKLVDLAQQDAGVSGSSLGWPTIAPDGSLYVSSDFGLVIALKSDGSLQWTYDTGAFSLGYLSDPAVGPDGTIYVSTQSGTPGAGVHAITSAGVRKWFASANQPDTSVPPTVGSDGSVFVGGLGVHAFTSAGARRWVFAPATESSMGYPVVDGNGTVYASGFVTIYAIDPTGAKAWEAALPGAQNDPAYSTQLGPVAIAANGTLYASFVGATSLAEYSPDLYAFTR